MNINNPTVSVVVPNYNYARYLKGRIDSILNQTYEDFELIILDDASTDNSLEIIDLYRQNPKVSHVVVNEKNTGSPFRQWMKGIEMARGAWVWVAEADDLSAPTFLEQCMRAVAAHPSAVACNAGSCFIDSEGIVMPVDANYWGKHSAGMHCFKGREYAAHNIYWSCSIANTSAAVFRRDAALSVRDCGFLQMRYAGDWMFWFHMALQGDIIELYQNLNFFRQHTQKVTNEGKRLGNGIVEDILVTRIMEQKISIGRYKKSLAHGLIYRKIRKSKLTNDRKRELYNQLRQELNGSKWDFYNVRLNRYLRFIVPGIVTMKGDRLRP